MLLQQKVGNVERITNKAGLSNKRGFIIIQGDKIDIRMKLTDSNQSSDILQHSQNRPTGDRWLKF